MDFNYDLMDASAQSGLEYIDLLEVLELYFEEAAEILEEINNAYHNQDRHYLKRLFHSLKGSSSNLGIRNVSDAARKLEEICATAPDSTVFSLVKELSAEVNSARIAVKKSFFDNGLDINI